MVEWQCLCRASTRHHRQPQPKQALRTWFWQRGLVGDQERAHHGTAQGPIPRRYVQHFQPQEPSLHLWRRQQRLCRHPLGWPPTLRQLSWRLRLGAGHHLGLPSRTRVGSWRTVPDPTGGQTQLLTAVPWETVQLATGCEDHFLTAAQTLTKRALRLDRGAFLLFGLSLER